MMMSLCLCWSFVVVARQQEEGMHLDLRSTSLVISHFFFKVRSKSKCSHKAGGMDGWRGGRSEGEISVFAVSVCVQGQENKERDMF